MAANETGPAGRYTLTAAGTLTAGQILKVGNIIGVVQSSVVSGDLYALYETGMFTRLVKKTGETWAVGDPLYWDDSAKSFTKTSATGLFFKGWAVDAIATSTVVISGEVMLLESPLAAQA